MQYDNSIYEIVKKIKDSCNDYLVYVKTYNECAYTDRKIENILDNLNKLAVSYENNFEDSIYKYNIINFHNDQDDLYVNYTVENTTTNDIANIIGYYNVSDIGCDYNSSSDEDIKDALLSLIKENNACEFNLPKVSELSPLLTYIYDTVCESESNMCHIDYNDWEELKEEEDFNTSDLINLRKEIEKYNLYDYLTVCDREYMICGYGGLQCCFNDDRERGNNEYER